MGPVSTTNIAIAPAFYYTQVGLSGPFKAYTLHNQRKTIKIWMCVFCCTTATTTTIKTMEDCSAATFIQAFIRFACEFGYPKKLLPDEGSQLINGCDSMKINYTDVKQFKCSYLQIAKYFAKFFLHFPNLHSILNTLKKKMSPRGDLFLKL